MTACKVVFFIPLVALLATISFLTPGEPAADQDGAPNLRVVATEDFEVTGDGSHAAWRKLPRRPPKRRKPGSRPCR